jgi:hypothetical protein
MNALLEWSSRIVFSDENVNEERGVVLEEWRTTLGLYERAMNELQQHRLQVLLNPPLSVPLSVSLSLSLSVSLSVSVSLSLSACVTSSLFARLSLPLSPTSGCSVYDAAVNSNS